MWEIENLGRLYEELRVTKMAVIARDTSICTSVLSNGKVWSMWEKKF